MISTKSVCRYKEVTQVFSVHHGFFSASSDDLATQDKAALLALSIVQTHPDGSVLTRYVMGNAMETS